MRGFPLTPPPSHFNGIPTKKHLFHSTPKPQTPTSPSLYPVTSKPQLYEKPMPRVTPDGNLARPEVEQVMPFPFTI